MSELFDFSLKRKNKLSILIDNCISVLKALNKSKEEKELDNYYDEEYVNFEIGRLKKLTGVTNLVEIKKMKEFQDFCCASGFFKEEIKAYNSILRNQYGFSLIELILVLGIGSSITFLSFQQMLRKQEDTLAKTVGEQIKQLGNSVNSYIAVHYDKLSTLQNADGTTTDPGPRNCVTTTSTCSISIQTLINEGLLPQTYSVQNLFNSAYTIALKRSGSAPYYNVTGIITTDNAWLGAGSSVRFDLLGKAMQEAGIDSGMTRENSNVLNGYKGLWNHTTTEFSNINKLGQLGYQVGYGSYSYSIYLRRDGSLPMTGNLNMGGQSINNAQDINGAGNLTMNGKGNFGNEISAKNGYGDIITLGGDASSNDYELRLGSGKPLSIYSPNSTQYSTVLSVNRNTVIGERLATNGLNPNDLPAGWAGGIRTNDIYAVGTIATGSGGAAPTYMNSSGNIYASNTITTSGNIAASGSANIGGNLSTGGETYTGGWFRTRGDSGWYSEKWGGGWYMSDPTWVRSYNNKPVYTGGQIRGGSIQSDGDMNAAGNASVNGGVYTNYLQTNGRLSVGEFAMFNGVANVGWACPTGLQGRDASGALLSCVYGVWRKGGGSTVLTGLIGNGQQIPLPGGFSQNQCQWSVSNSENPHGWKPNYFAGQVATSDANRIVKCGYYDEYNFIPGTNRADLSGRCSYIVTCN